MKITKLILSAGIIACAVFTSCSTLQQDVIVTTDQNSELNEISNFEFRLVHLDSDYSYNENPAPQELEQKNEACDKLIKDINELLNKKDLILSVKARLYAILGRTYLIKNNSAKAKEYLQLSDKAYKGDIQTLILSHRLGLTQDLANATFVSQDKPLVLIEEAIDFYKSKEYMFAVAKFDEAFINAESYYKDSYKELRDKSWELRTIKETSPVSAYLAKKELTIGQMMMITQSIPSVLYPYTAGNEFSENQLFRKLVQKGLITSVPKTEPPAKTYSYTILTRTLEARFLWNLYCNKKNKPALRTRYSTAYSEPGMTSPVSDVKISSEDFDAIIGCIEYGLMDLPDGENFNPEGTVSGIEFEKNIKKLEK
ncbi:MAG: hypothetical protein KBT21_10595 [Treponema sp.]|nr:hypothetical protein [Candidatus Treponema merdequi]